MTEKNIVVTSGRPMNPGGGGGGGGGMGMGSWLSGYTYAHISGPDPAQRQAFTSVHRYESNARKRIVAAYEKSLQALPKTVTDEVARLESELLAPTKNPVDSFARIKSILQNLYNQAIARRDVEKKLSLAYNGAEPTTRDVPYHPAYSTSYARGEGGYGAMVQLWIKSHEAHYQALIMDQMAKFLSEQIALVAAAQTEAIKKANTFTLPVLTDKAEMGVAAGSIAITAGSKMTLDAALQAGIQALKGIGSVALDRVTGVGIGLLVYSPQLGNGDLHPSTMMTVPAKSIAPSLPVNLLAVASSGGSVDVPYRVYGEQHKYSVVATTSSGGVSAKVPVRALTFNASLNAYTFTTADTPSRTLVFPIATPGNSSTSTPAKPVAVPVYTGVTLTPLEIKAEELPAVDQLDIHDCIYCFPAGSGLPPIYAVFSESLDSGKFSRKQLDKKFKHANSFGVTDTRKNIETLSKFRDAVNEHLADVDTSPHGTYQRETDSTVFFNKRTNNVVIIGGDGKFVSGWKLDPATPQFKNYIEKGVLQ